MLDYEIDLSNLDIEGTAYLVGFIFYTLLTLAHLFVKRSKIVKNDIPSELRKRILNPPIDTSYDPFKNDFERLVFKEKSAVATRYSIQTSKSMNAFSEIEVYLNCDKAKDAISLLTNFIVTNNNSMDLSKFKDLISRYHLKTSNWALVELHLSMATESLSVTKVLANEVLQQSYEFNLDVVSMALSLGGNPILGLLELVHLKQIEKIQLYLKYSPNLDFITYDDCKIVFKNEDNGEIFYVEKMFKAEPHLKGFPLGKVITVIIPALLRIS